MRLFGKERNKKADSERTIQEQSRYKDNPMNLFFENFILDTINELPKDKYDQINRMNLAKVFKTEPMDWKLIIKKTLNLSDTIEIAILDLWYRNQEIAGNRVIDYQPNQFAVDFVDNYLKEDSKIDIWEGDNLEQAKKRITEYQLNNK